MRFALLAVGKLRPAFRSACDDYRRRLRRFAHVDEIEVREAGSRAEPGQAAAVEARQLLKRLPERSLVVALSREGAAWSSRDVARELDRWRHAGKPVTAVIGGSEGLDPSVLDRADAAWSLGPLTLPHELARVIVYEQLYRGFTILQGMPYHKGGER